MAAWLLEVRRRFLVAFFSFSLETQNFCKHLFFCHLFVGQNVSS